MDFAEALSRSLRNPCWELRLPKPHLRHNKEPALISHRFPIKNGLTMGEALAWRMCRPSPIFTAMSRNLDLIESAYQREYMRKRRAKQKLV